MGSEGDPALLRGFIAGERAPSEAFFTRLMPFVRGFIVNRYPRLQHRRDDLESRAVSLLVDWRQRKLLREDESLAHLAGRLIKEAGRAEGRELAGERAAAGEIAARPPEREASAEDRVIAQDAAEKILEAVADLPESYAAALRARLAEDAGGPRMATVLGVEPATARKTLERAHAALNRRIQELGIDLPDWLAAARKTGTHAAGDPHD